MEQQGNGQRVYNNGEETTTCPALW